MKEWFLARRYPKIVVNNQIEKVVFGGDQPVKENLESGIPFVTTYHPRLKSLEKWLGTYFLFYTVMEKFKSFSHFPQLYLTEVREK